TWAALALGYLMGSIPFGFILTRMAGLGDIRRIGSGNIGATNVLRTGNRKLALLTLLLDGAKGAVAALIAGSVSPGLALVAALAAFLGHLFPVWLHFKGGKGVATYLGVLLALCWPLGLMVVGTWIGTAILFRISSLSALTAALLCPIFAWVLAGPALAILTLLMSVLVFIRHDTNIRRLLNGTEPRIGRS
ncbi:MAG TPA: glycerol-3-phosphate 1-O-acyltransferase PlsY, partial [Sphingomonadales bacterium]